MVVADVAALRSVLVDAANANASAVVQLPPDLSLALEEPLVVAAGLSVRLIGSASPVVALAAADGGGGRRLLTDGGVGSTELPSANSSTATAAAYGSSTNTTIDGGGVTRLFTVLGELQLDGVTLANGRAGDGGCVYVHPGGRAVIRDATFVDCTAMGEGLGGSSSVSSSSSSVFDKEAEGGALYLSTGSTASVARSHFLRCGAYYTGFGTTASGGAIYVGASASISVTASHFEKCYTKTTGTLLPVLSDSGLGFCSTDSGCKMALAEHNVLTREDGGAGLCWSQFTIKNPIPFLPDVDVGMCMPFEPYPPRGSNRYR